MMKVLVVQSTVKQYRVPFFERLRDALEEAGIELTVAYSVPDKADRRGYDHQLLPDTYGMVVPGRWLLGDRVFHQPIAKRAMESDLVVVEQALKNTACYQALALAMLGRCKQAYWGHGRNRQAGANSAVETIKRAVLRKTDWWFAYTAGTAEYLTSCGVPATRVTVVQNSIDTSAFRRIVEDLTPEQKARTRGRTGIEADARVGLYCGSYHEHKHIEFLLQAARELRQRVPAFEMILIGDGPEVDRLLAPGLESWIHYVGPRFGDDRTEYFGISELFLNPGMVGLSILDAFAAGLPMATTALSTHSPEIEYLDEGVNGLITAHDPSAYAEKVAGVLLHGDRLRDMQRAARQSADRYPLTTMVSNFRDGIIACLSLPGSHGVR